MKQRTWTLIYCGSVYALAVLVLTTLVPEWGTWYSSLDHFRRQTDVFLRGEVALGTQPAALEHDLAWAEGKIQQIWGLAIPLWRLPFECAARLCRQPGFPDRLALGIALAGAAVLVLRVFVFRPALPPLDSLRHHPLGAAAGAMLLAYPPWITLCQGRFWVYEEVTTYMYLYCIALFAGLVGLCRRPTSGRYLLLCGLSGAAAWVRPTALFYGLATFLLAFQLARRAQCPRRSLWTGVGVYLCCGGLLLASNRARFGDALEFGHRLTVSHITPMVYASRFDHPYRHEPVGSACRDLFGSLFLVDRYNGYDWYRPDFFPGQSRTLRWREFYFRTFDLSHLALFLLGTIVCLGVAASRRTPPPVSRAEAALPVVWSILALASLGVFYLRFPFMASRYLLDFGPALVAVPVGACLCLKPWLESGLKASHRWPHATAGALLLWVVVEIALGHRAYAPAYSVARVKDSFYHVPSAITHLSMKVERRRYDVGPAALPSSYPAPSNQVAAVCRYNGEGWNLRTGETEPVVTLFVQDPRSLTLRVSARDPANPPDPAVLRAKVGLEFLERSSIQAVGQNEWRVTFRPPATPKYRQGIQVAFIALVTPDQLTAASSGFLLRAVDWRNPPELVPRAAPPVFASKPSRSENLAARPGGDRTIRSPPPPRTAVRAGLRAARPTWPRRFRDTRRRYSPATDRSAQHPMRSGRPTTRWQWHGPGCCT